MNIYGHLSYHTSTLRSSNAAIAPHETSELALKQLVWIPSIAQPDGERPGPAFRLFDIFRL